MHYTSLTINPPLGTSIALLLPAISPDLIHFNDEKVISVPYNEYGYLHRQHGARHQGKEDRNGSPARA